MEREGKTDVGKEKGRHVKELRASSPARSGADRPAATMSTWRSRRTNKEGLQCIKLKQVASAARLVGPCAQGHEEATSSTAAVTSKQTNGEKKYRGAVGQLVQSVATKYMFALFSNSLF